MNRSTQLRCCKLSVRALAVYLIRGYQILISPYLGDCCRFCPSCSEYARLAIERHGVIYGLWLAVRRLLRCHPGCRGDSYDPVPEQRGSWLNNH